MTRDAALDALGRFRSEIETVDRELVALLAKRVALSKEIGVAQKVAGLPTLDPGARGGGLSRAGMARGRAQ
jgi:chorismate mutase